MNDDETTDAVWPPCPDCGAEGDARCHDDCPRVRGQTGVTFDGSAVPVRWTQTEVTP